MSETEFIFTTIAIYSNRSRTFLISAIFVLNLTINHRLKYSSQFGVLNLNHSVINSRVSELACRIVNRRLCRSKSLPALALIILTHHCHTLSK